MCRVNAVLGFTIVYVCDEFKLDIVKQNTRFRKAISLRKRVAITFWVLATTVENRTIGHRFGVAQYIQFVV